jgi:hypothetical protein
MNADYLLIETNQGIVIINRVKACNHTLFFQFLARLDELFKSSNWSALKSVILANPSNNQVLISILENIMKLIPASITLEWQDIPDLIDFLQTLKQWHEIVPPPSIKDDDFLEVKSCGNDTHDFIASLISAFNVEGAFYLWENLDYQALINIQWRYSQLKRDPEKLKKEAERDRAMKILTDKKEMDALSKAFESMRRKLDDEQKTK